MGKLISMTDFVLSEDLKDTLYMDAIDFVKNYARFLKLPLTLGMFVPVDKHGVILENLKLCCNSSDCGCMGMPVNVSSQQEIDEYYEAEEKVLFEGFEVIREKEGLKVNYFLIHSKTKRVVFNKINGFDWELNINANDCIENLLNWDLELTESAKKMIRNNNFIYL